MLIQLIKHSARLQHFIFRQLYIVSWSCLVSILYFTTELLCVLESIMHDVFVYQYLIWINQQGALYYHWLYLSPAWLVGLRPVIQILCHVLARGWGRWLRYFTEAKAEVKYRASTRIPCQRPNPNYDTTPIPSLQNSQNKCQKSSFTYDHRRHLILPLPPEHALTTVNAPSCC